MNISEGRNRLMRKVTLAVTMSDDDTEEGMIVDLPLDIIDSNLRVHENPDEEYVVPLLERERERSDTARFTIK